MADPFQPPDPHFAERVRASFQQQTVMAAIGASVCSVAPGAVEIELPYRGDLCQQDGFLHAGIVTTIVDSACGYAAYTLMPAGTRVLSVEFKINFPSSSGFCGLAINEAKLAKIDWEWSRCLSAIVTENEQKLPNGTNE